jgi:hypothetical protein
VTKIGSNDISGLLREDNQFRNLIEINFINVLDPKQHFFILHKFHLVSIGSIDGHYSN